MHFLKLTKTYVTLVGMSDKRYEEIFQTKKKKKIR